MPAAKELRPGPLVGKGLTSEVYAFGEGRVIKIFYDWVLPEKVECEFRVTKAVHAIGVPVPRPFEIAKIGTKRGIVFEKLEGLSLFRSLLQKPSKLFAGARQMAEWHAHLHSFGAPTELPSQQSQIKAWIAEGKELSRVERVASEKCLEQLKPGSAICHGDFHPENVILTAKGPMIIDWTGGTRGDPIVDVARTASLIRRAEMPNDCPFFLRLMIGLSRELLLKTYLNRYFQVRPGRREELRWWDPIQKAGWAAWNARMETPHD